MGNKEKLYIFNPETEMALAANRDSYTPPANIRRLKEMNALLPVLYAENNSSILVPSGIPLSNYPKELLELSSVKHLNFIDETKLNNTLWEIHPWGWNRDLRHFLLRHGVIESSLPTLAYLDELKNLAHRRTTILIQQELHRRIPNYNIALPIEFCDENVAYEWAADNTGAYMKAPWSSSGRGVFHSQEQYNPLMKQWIHGIVSRQGSVIGEVGLERVLDFATEWQAENGVVRFLGFSVFEAGENGQYKGNKLASQEELEKIIESKSSEWNGVYLDILQEILTEVIAPKFTGVFGVDMLVAKDERINLCVEVNLRMTMGHVALELWNSNHENGYVRIQI